MEQLDTLIATCRYLRGVTDRKIRINTNGLSDLIHGKPTAHLLEGLVDSISISLNAGTPKEYNRITRPVYGEAAFDAMLKFAEDCKKYIPHVMFTVVDVISPEEISAAQAVADKMGIPLRVRAYEG